MLYHYWTSAQPAKENGVQLYDPRVQTCGALDISYLDFHLAKQTSCDALLRCQSSISEAVVQPEHPWIFFVTDERLDCFLEFVLWGIVGHSFPCRPRFACYGFARTAVAPLA